MSNNLARGQEKFINPIGDYTKEESCDDLQYQTGQNVNGQKRAADTIVYGTYAVSTGNAIATGSTKRVIIKAAHVARKNDVIQFTSGSNSGIAIQILSCPDANTMILAATAEFDLTVGDTFDIKRYVSPQYNSDGSLNVAAVFTPAIPVPSFQDSAVVTDGGVITFSAPVGAKWAKIHAADDNPDKLRVRVDGTAPTAIRGHQFEPGRSEDFQATGDVKVIAETAVGNNYICVTFGV